MNEKPYTTLREVVLNEPLVGRIKATGGSDEDCVIAMANLVLELRSSLMKLDIIAPRKVVLSDGKVMVWHCPDHLIPEQQTIRISREQWRA